MPVKLDYFPFLFQCRLGMMLIPGVRVCLAKFVWTGTGGSRKIASFHETCQWYAGWQCSEVRERERESGNRLKQLIAHIFSAQVLQVELRSAPPPTELGYYDRPTTDKPTNKQADMRVHREVTFLTSALSMGVWEWGLSELTLIYTWCGTETIKCYFY